ncbi:uncharacterized protein LOC131525739 isoform X1 [Onychostoma macrolepis]|uniref:Uncharacterized protein n=1 Tax=Onychostoma macrolepis TaxID=369639 RepID=A0A7J6BYK6_9TELE|nr:uncharacterized protein LOC131525739 isoform X1 [Onychostoma macrolepis]KAF4100040.1 hypothetical protein G5714_018236 [Onychostoma macrolepis]
MRVTALLCLSLHGVILTAHSMSDLLAFALLLCSSELRCDAVGSSVSGLQHQRVRPGGMAVLPCGQLQAGRVTWSRDLHGRQVSILSTENGDVTRHLQDHNHSSLPDRSLLIWFVSSWDQGLYYCNGTPAACLTVRAADGQNREDLAACLRGAERVDVTERVLMFAGVALAALTLLSATAAAVKASHSIRRETRRSRSADLYINLREHQSN